MITNWGTFIIPLCSALALSGCGLGLNRTASPVATVSPVATSSFGITSISNLSGTSMQLNWSAMTNAASYQVYNLTSGSPAYVATVIAPTTSYTVTGLSQASTYTYRVRATDTSGDTDTNTTNVSATTLTVAATHTGWSDIKALGSKTPVTQSGLSTAPASVTLTWNASTLSSSVATSYNIYRATVSGAQDYSSPLATGIATGTRSYTDSTVSNGTTYYYTIAPIVGGTVTPVSASADSEVKVIVPPANMVLLHRWAANQEMCGLMGRTSDRANDYRCNYTGPGGTGTYYDVLRSTLVDAYELGCNYTAAPACDATNGCLGTGDPAGGTGVVNNVYYNRASGKCFVKTASTTWNEANTSGLASAYRTLMASNKPGLPPLVVIDQNRSYESCQAQSESGFAGNKKLLTHQQQILAGAWSSGTSDVTIVNIENGTSLPSSGYCNSNSGSGLTYDNLVTPANLETITGTNAGGIKSVRTGGTSTNNCVSRYGAQDLTGNVWEWSSDQLNTCSSGTHTCTAVTSALDTVNTDWNGFNFSGAIGPGGGGSNVTEWDFSAMSFSATQFLAPLGLPMVAAAASSYDYLAIGSGAGQFNPTLFHGNHFWLGTDNGNGTPARGAMAGGAWDGGSLSGRFTLLLLGTPAYTLYNVGARCALPAE